MTYPGPDPGTSPDEAQELAHMEAIRAVRDAAEARIGAAHNLYRRALAALQAEAEAALQPHTDAYAAAAGPIIDDMTAKKAEVIGDYQRALCQLRAESDEAALQLRLLHTERMRRLHDGQPQCPACGSYRVTGGKCMRCNGEPPQARRTAPRRERVQA